MEKRRRAARKKCAFCSKNILDPGYQLLSKVNVENLLNWCEIMMNMDSKDVMAKIKQAWVCRYCIWDARFYHEHTGGNENTVWWSKNDDMYKYYERNMIKPCELRMRKMTKYQIHRITDSKKIFTCSVCGQRHGTHNAMYLHLYFKHKDLKFATCPLCNKLVEANNGLEAHFAEFHEGEISTSLKSKVLKCQLCNKIFTGQGRKYQRSQHLKNSHPNDAVRCAWFGCCRYFRTQAAMEKHANEKHNDVMAREKVRCIFCGVQYLDNQVLSGHVRKKHKLEAHFCPIRICRRNFKTEEEMQAHLKEVHENALTDEKIACIFCGQRISSLSYRIHHHMRLKHPKVAFKCKKIVCTSYFKTKAAAMEHFKAAHAEDKKAQIRLVCCDTCQFQTRSIYNLELHIVAKHFPRTTKCPECPKMFASEKHVHEHARKTHSKSRKKCPHCGTAPAIYNSHVVNTQCLKCCQPFKCFGLVKKHKKVCKLSFECDVCDKQFIIESMLTKHFNAVHRKVCKSLWIGAKKHSKSKFKCVDCKMYFAHEGFLNSHFRNIHIDVNKVTCHICGKLVRCKSRMEYHLVHVHRVGQRPSIKLRGF